MKTLDFVERDTPGLYERLANSVCKGDEWKLDANRINSAYEFGNWVHHQRVVADIETGLLTTIASEIYNHGEYTFAAPLFRAWMETLLGFSPEATRHSLAYIVVHTGTTESDHFMHGIDALKSYYAGIGMSMDYEKVTASCAEYLKRVAGAFAGIDASLDDTILCFLPVGSLAGTAPF